MQNINEEVLNDFNATIKKMIENGFRFTTVHNPEEEKITIISCTKPDKIKHKIPEFNIFLSGKQKIVDRVFFYAE